ncbi:hypothetical protein FRC16_008004, partial [Serendipita sp. 398]
LLSVPERIDDLYNYQGVDHNHQSFNDHNQDNFDHCCVNRNLHRSDQIQVLW